MKAFSILIMVFMTAFGERLRTVGQEIGRELVIFVDSDKLDVNIAGFGDGKMMRRIELLK